jgi:cell division protein ZapB
MELDLEALEDRINTLAMLCLDLRQENAHLRQALDDSREESQQLNHKVETVKARLDDKIPLDAEEESA